MICFLNRKRVLLDTDPQELARVKTRLDQAGIAYEVKTTTSDNVLSRNVNAAASMRYVTTYSAAQNQLYLYQVFVRRRDYQAAKKAITRK